MSTSTSNSKKILIVAVVVAALVGAGLLVLRQKSRLGAEKPPEPTPVMVDALALKTARVVLTLPLLADVQAVKEVNMASRLTGYVAALPLFEGDRFKRGQLLARIDMTLADGMPSQGDSLKADLAAATSADVAARERMERSQKLHAIGGVSTEQLRADEAAASAAGARLAVARENLRNATLVAPFDGVVSQRLAQPGDLVTPGKPLLRLVADGEQRLLVSLPDATPAIALRWQDKVLPLKPWPEANAQGLRRFEARAMDLAPGTRLNVELVTFDANAVLLPDACLLNNNGRSATVFQLGDTGPAKALSVALAASGTQGAASTDALLNGIRVACGGADVLTRLALGVPFNTAKGN